MDVPDRLVVCIFDTDAGVSYLFRFTVLARIRIDVVETVVADSCFLDRGCVFRHRRNFGIVLPRD